MICENIFQKFMQTEFFKLFNYIKNLESRYLNILGAYTVYDSLGSLIAPNKIGKNKADENVKIINGFKYFGSFIFRTAIF